jgi:protease I
MKGRTSLTNRFARYSQGLHVPLLVLLALATISWGQQPQAGMRRRTTAAPRLKTIQLPEPSTAGAVSVEQALLEQQRVSIPSDQRLEFAALGQLAWAAQGVRVPRGASATAATLNQLPAMRLYFILPDGVYSYNPSDHSLQQMSGNDERQTMATALVNRAGAPVGGAQIVLAGSSREFALQYGVQARTAMLLQAGQAAQSLQLQAIGLGLTFVSIDNVNLNSVRRAVRLTKGVDPLYVIFVGYPGGKASTAAAAQPTATQPVNRKVLIVVPQQAFQDQELFETKRALELAGVPVQVASTRLTSLTGMMGGTANADLLLTQAKLGDYGAIVFIGGPGVAEYFSNPTVMNLARQAADQRKVVAAIGTAPTILANAGILKGVQVTGYLPEQARIVQGGGKYTGNSVEKDGLIITATSAPAVPLFVQAILEGLGQGG